MNQRANSLSQYEQKNSDKMLFVIVTYLAVNIAQENSICTNDFNHQLHKIDILIL